MKKLTFLLHLLTLSVQSLAQSFTPNYDEAKVGSYTLPNPLLMPNGQRINTPAQWRQQRIYWLNQFAEQVYGHTPTQKVQVRYETVSVSNALEGRAMRKIVRIYFTQYPQLAPIEVLLYIPTRVHYPVAVAVGLNFMGNHSVTTEPDVPISTRWATNTSDSAVVNHRFTEKSRGRQASRWAINELMNNDIALATAYYGDIEPDYPDGWRSGIRSVLGDSSQPNNWGAIGAWAWGLSRIMDYLQTEKQIDTRRSFLTGHSRLGKAALWAAAQDERFAAVNSNCSGEGGAALARRNFGETVARINSSFPHWFCQNFKKYNENPNSLPTDQHLLLALIAPRPLYVASAEDDLWADPYGEFLSLKAAQPVYQLYGVKDFPIEKQPPVNLPIGEKIRYHIRTGKHDVTAYDWAQYIDFIQKQLVPSVITKDNPSKKRTN
ncbi:MAG: alpha/beta hydrolase family protein [Runella sp.]